MHNIPEINAAQERIGELMEYYHVDVFSKNPMKGNGLTVIFPKEPVSDEGLLKIAQEFNQFESIFIYPEEDNVYPARIFTVEEELEFAGHPILGAAAVIMTKYDNADQTDIIFEVKGRKITTTAEIGNNGISVEMNQGKPAFIKEINSNEIDDIIKSVNLTNYDIAENYPAEVVSTGLNYLLLPVKNYNSLAKSKIIVSNLEHQLNAVDAKFIYIFDPETLECRTWDNLGKVEDVATGSAAGPLCAYLVKNGFREKDEKIMINQGSFLNRAGIIEAWIDSNSDDVIIKGDVSFFAKGELTPSISEFC